MRLVVMRSQLERDAPSRVKQEEQEPSVPPAVLCIRDRWGRLFVFTRHLVLLTGLRIEEVEVSEMFRYFSHRLRFNISSFRRLHLLFPRLLRRFAVKGGSLGLPSCDWIAALTSSINLTLKPGSSCAVSLRCVPAAPAPHDALLRAPKGTAPPHSEEQPPEAHRNRADSRAVNSGAFDRAPGGAAELPLAVSGLSSAEERFSRSGFDTRCEEPSSESSRSAELPKLQQRSRSRFIGGVKLNVKNIKASREPQESLQKGESPYPSSLNVVLPLSELSQELHRETLLVAFKLVPFCWRTASALQLQCSLKSSEDLGLSVLASHSPAMTSTFTLKYF
ncbi:hypothetical protein DNTS_005286 [Danionella cerebrum]|uniref:Uncharacterized protein n=1 Tax=Danionella cerebrum TaxID=2873325 RepID=A0A553R8U8_9TELE|nr:hypothetical protein DNTS_005286 [Danionella translucida]